MRKIELLDVRRNALLIVFLSLFTPLKTFAEEGLNLAIEPLDGVVIEAVDVYKNPNGHEITFGIGMFPFSSYYNGFSVNVGYSVHYSKRWAWEILNANYVYAVNSDITSQLADKYGVSPESIEKLSYLASTNLFYTFAYGKYVYSEKYLHYFRSALIFGGGYLSTNENASFTFNFGWRIDVYISNSF